MPRRSFPPTDSAARTAAILASPSFALALALLLLNDWVLKSSFPGWWTGKLSDVAGLYAFSLFWCALFPRRPGTVVAATALAFLAWKSPLADPALGAWNALGLWPVARVVDYTDWLALAVLLPAWRRARAAAGVSLAPRRHATRRIRALAAAGVAIVAIVAFAATSRRFDVAYGPEDDASWTVAAPMAEVSASIDSIGVTVIGRDRSAEREALSLRIDPSPSGIYGSVDAELRATATGETAVTLLRAYVLNGEPDRDAFRRAFVEQVVEPLRARAARGGSIPPGGAASLDGSEWIVSRLDGQPVLAATRLTLRFRDGVAGGYGGCNWYGGDYTAVGSALRIGTIASSARGCIARGVAEQEARLHDALRRTMSYRIGGGRLALLDDAGAVLLEATPRERAAMDPADLVGTRWRLHAVGDTLEGEPSITLDLMEGTLSGFGGCRGYDGTYVADGDEIGVTSIAMRDTECDAGEAANLREGQFTTDLSESTNWRLSADSLVLLAVSGRRLVFVPRR